MSVLLILIDPKGLTLANNLQSPKSLHVCNFNETLDALLSHYKPKRIVIFELHKFQTENQNSGESIADHIASIKELARMCDYALRKLYFHFLSQ